MHRVANALQRWFKRVQVEISNSLFNSGRVVVRKLERSEKEAKTKLTGHVIVNSKKKDLCPASILKILAKTVA